MSSRAVFLRRNPNQLQAPSPAAGRRPAGPELAMVRPAQPSTSRSPAAPSPAPLRVQRVPVECLLHDPANARLHGAGNLDAITARLKRFGQAEPLVVLAGTGMVIAGNGRMDVMRALRWEECDEVELDEAGNAPKVVV